MISKARHVQGKLLNTKILERLIIAIALQKLSLGDCQTYLAFNTFPNKSKNLLEKLLFLETNKASVMQITFPQTRDIRFPRKASRCISEFSGNQVGVTWVSSYACLQDCSLKLIDCSCKWHSKKEVKKFTIWVFMKELECLFVLRRSITYWNAWTYK